MAATALLALVMWANSGTLAPYAATLDAPVVDRECGYLLNLDHIHFLAVFWYLEGQPPEAWDYSIYFRRILYPILAYPLVDAFGYLRGGFLTNVALTAVGVLVFASWLRARWGKTAGRIALVILATYPGVAYWGGLPYNHASICFVALTGVVLLDLVLRLPRWWAQTGLVLVMGVLCLCYDFLAIFAGSLFVTLLWKRRWRAMLAYPVVLAIPMALLLAWQQQELGISPSNDNTSVYPVILKSYLPPYDLKGWLGYLQTAPAHLGYAFLFSTFLGLPLGFLLAVLVLWKRRAAAACFSPAETGIGLVVAGLWLFCNLAPPYEGWQMRGYHVVRIYMPVFVLYTAFLSRAAARHRPAQVGVVLAVTLNLAVVFGGLMKSPLAAHVYHRFNRHALKPMYLENLEIYGVRPLGFCREIENAEKAWP